MADDGKFQTTAEWKNFGNKQFVLKRYKDAIKAYTNGLSLSNNSPPDADLLANRAAAYLNLERYALALNDTRLALKVDPTHMKAILRNAKALLGLGKYKEAVAFIKREISKSNQKAPYNKEIKDLLEKAESMLLQSRTGEYDVSEYMDKPFARIDTWATYKGPVTIKPIPGKGRGLVATENLVEGQLLMAQKAFAICFLDPDNKEEEPEDNIMTMECVHTLHDYSGRWLIQKIYGRIKEEPEVGKDFYQLYAGEKLGTLDPKKDDCSKPDVERISGVVRHNCFANSGETYPDVEKSAGLWILPSYFNHLCVGGNCTWKIYGNFIFIRTYRAINKGEEMIFSYASPTWSYKVRNELLIKRLGFRCTCQLCTLENELTAQQVIQRENLLQLVRKQDIDFLALNPSSSPAEIYKKFQLSSTLLHEVIKKLEEMHPKHGLLNVFLIDALEKLGMKYFGVGEYEKAAEYMQKAHAIMKAVGLPHGAIDSMFWVVASYLHMQDTKMAKYWIEILKKDAQLAHGTLNVLRLMGEWVLEAMAEQGVTL